MSEITTMVPVSGMLVLPKIRLDGTAKITSIDPFAITGTEPAVVSFKGKKYDGAKIYTSKGWFKVIAPATTVLLAQHQAKKGSLVTVDALAKLPEYQKEVALLKASN